MDRMIKGYNDHLRFFAVEATETVETARIIHSLESAETVCFGKFLIAALMMGYNLKNETDLITLRCDTNDEYLTVTANNKGEVKGYPSVRIPTGDSIRESIISKLINGNLTVIRDTGLKIPYNSSIKLITGEIARDLTYYYHTSEQTPSVVGLNISLTPKGTVERAYGFIVQLLPGTKEDIIETLELNMRQLPDLTDISDMGCSLDWILSNMILKNIPYQISEEIEAKYYCNCNKDRFRRGLSLLDNEELIGIAEENQDVIVKCHTCNTEYTFTVDEIKEIMTEKDENL